MGKKLDDNEIAALLADTPRGRGTVKADPTEPRNVDTWFKLPQVIKESGCENPTCADPRPRNDRGVNIVAEVRGKYMCRFCYLNLWLSPIKPAGEHNEN